jgi:3-oxoacyl-[acyl-carrier protein] reductase
MRDAISLEGKTIVVTGAAQAIGQAIASLAIGLGARCLLRRRRDPYDRNDQG